VASVGAGRIRRSLAALADTMRGDPAM